jgi:hypothetical protein
MAGIKASSCLKEQAISQVLHPPQVDISKIIETSQTERPFIL